MDSYPFSRMKQRAEQRQKFADLIIDILWIQNSYCYPVVCKECWKTLEKEREIKYGSEYEPDPNPEGLVSFGLDIGPKELDYEHWVLGTAKDNKIRVAL